MNAGAALEAGIKKAATRYAAAGRAELAKQYTPRAFGGLFVAKAPIDFKGWYRDERGERPPLWLEAKHTVDGRLDFADAGGGLHMAQLEALQDAVKRGIRALLVVEFAQPLGVVHVAEARDVVAFAAAPWRSSLSIDWFRANGRLAAVESTPERIVWFLDTSVHPLRHVAADRVAAEQAAAGGRVVALYPSSKLKRGELADTFRDLLKRKPGRDAPEAERIAWLNEMTAWELERDIREAKKMQARAKQKTRGWRR